MSGFLFYSKKNRIAGLYVLVKAGMYILGITLWGTLGKNYNRMSIFQGEVDFSWWPIAILYTPSLSHQLQGTGNMNFDQNIDP